MKKRAVIVLFVAVAILTAGSALAADATELMCTPCNLKFDSKEALARHAIEHHGARGCLACGVLLESDTAAAVHAVLHHGATTCPLCHKDLASSAAAQAHLVEAHDVPGCKLCKKVFETADEAAEHAKMHEKKAPAKSD